MWVGESFGEGSTLSEEKEGAEGLLEGGGAQRAGCKVSKKEKEKEKTCCQVSNTENNSPCLVVTSSIRTEPVFLQYFNTNTTTKRKKKKRARVGEEVVETVANHNVCKQGVS